MNTTVGIIAIVCLVAVSPTLAFVITPPISRHEHVVTRLTPLTHSKSLTSGNYALSILFSQQSSSTSIDSTNQTESGSLSESFYHHSSTNDIVAMMTSNAMEAEVDPLFLSYVSQLPTEARIIQNDKGTNDIDDIAPYQSASLVTSIPKNERSEERRVGKECRP